MNLPLTKLSLSGIALLHLSLLSRAEPIISDTFDQPVLAPGWSTVEAKPTIQSGFILLKTVNDREEAWVNSGLRFGPEPALNFVNHPVEIILEDLSINGTAQPGDQSFKCVISNQISGESSLREAFQLSVSGAGVLSFSVQSWENGDATSKGLFVIEAQLPLRQVSLVLSKESIILRFVDALGEKERKYGLKESDFQPSQWEDASPVITLISTRNPSSGDSACRLGGITAKSISNRD